MTEGIGTSAIARVPSGPVEGKPGGILPPSSAAFRQLAGSL